jgi:hypothetical protein
MKSMPDYKYRSGLAAQHSLKERHDDPRLGNILDNSKLEKPLTTTGGP